MDGSIRNTVEEFRENGFIRVEQAFDAETTQACVEAIEEELRAQSLDQGDPSTWTEPVVRFVCPEGPALATAGTSPALWTLYDALLGDGNWIKRQAVGGTVAVRFPSDCDPGDAGWHIDGSYEVGGQYFVNVHSRRRALLALFLFTDVTERDAPTEIVVGSHRDIPRVLHPYGERGVFSGDVMPSVPESIFDRPREHALGRAGDVFVCHPFLVHRATWPHRGTNPRIIAQPEIAHYEQFELRLGKQRCVVEDTILESLNR